MPAIGQCYLLLSAGGERTKKGKGGNKKKLFHFVIDFIKDTNHKANRRSVARLNNCDGGNCLRNIKRLVSITLNNPKEMISQFLMQLMGLVQTDADGYKLA